MTRNTLSETKGFRIRKRKLPHWEIGGSAYFVTFGTNKRLNLTDAAKDITLESIKFHDGRRYQLYGCVVMATHVHMVFEPLRAQAQRPVLPASDSRYHSLSQIMHGIKSYSASRIQKMMPINGSVWLDESYDRVVRDEEEFVEKLNYIINNPIKAGLATRPEDYRWLYVRQEYLA